MIVEEPASARGPRLVVATAAGEVADEAPVAWLDDGTTVDVRYALTRGRGGAVTVSFAVARYERAKTLLLDPAVVSQSGFPAVTGPDLTFGGSVDRWVARVAADGKSLEYCGYIGGDGYEDRALGLDVNSSGRCYVVGRTNSSDETFPVTVSPDVGGDGNAYLVGTTNAGDDFPAVVGPDLTYNGGVGDGFVAKIVASGQSLAWCGFVGGSEWNGIGGVAVDRLGGVWVAGFEQSTEGSAVPPVLVNGPDDTHNGKTDGYVGRILPDGTGFDFAGYFGGVDNDSLLGLAFLAPSPAEPDKVEAWLVGSTESDETTLPVSVGPDLTHNGGVDAVVVRITTTVAPPVGPTPTLTLTAKGGKLKDSEKPGKDKFAYKGTFEFGAESPDGAFDPTAETLTLTCGAEAAPRVLVVPANDPAWKVKPGRWLRWRVKGALAKFNVKKGVLVVRRSKFDFPDTRALPIGFAVEFGDDDGEDGSDWIASPKPGRFNIVK